MNTSTMATYRSDRRRFDALKLFGLFAVPIALFVGILFYSSTDGAAYPMRDEALQTAVLAKLQTRLTSLGVSRMDWSACRMDNPVTTESEIDASTGTYHFGPSGDYDACDASPVNRVVRWAYVIKRSPDGSYQMLMHDIDHDVMFATYRDAAIKSANAALSQLDSQIQTDEANVKLRVQAQPSWQTSS